MNQKELLKEIALLEDGKRQFKKKISSADKLAEEMAAFANSQGGTIYIGVNNDGTPAGLNPADVDDLNKLISNVATNNIKSPISVDTENVPLPNGKLVVLVKVPEGKSKPYLVKDGAIWIKKGSDKRKITSREEILRLFQSSGDYRGDEEVSKAGIDKIDKLRFRDYLKKEYGRDYPDTDEELLQILQNINLATDHGKLNKAGVLLFAEHPELIYPEFVIKAIRFPGNNIHATEFIDDEKIVGPLSAMYERAMAFIKRNLRNIQAGQSVNAPGKLEIPEGVFEELLVNALTHRDYFLSAPIRIFVLDNRIEIISPGDLPNHLTVEQIKKGQNNIRNRIIALFVSNGLLPYRGIGTGVRRALKLWPDITFDNDSEGSQFTVSIKRKELIQTLKIVDTISLESSEKTGEKILKLMKNNPEITMAEISEAIGVSESAIEKQLVKLRINRKIERVGSRKSGYWKVLEQK